MSRVVVIGAGLGGLAVAARLAALGHRVTVCEQADRVGGKLTARTLGRYVFDTGPSLLTMPQVFEELFTATGDPLADVLPLQRVAPAQLRFADGSRLTPGVTGPLSDLPEWSALMAHARRLWEATRGPFLEAPLDGTATLARLALRRPGDIPLVAPWRTLRRLGRARLHDPRLRTALDRYATYSGSDPRRAPAALAVIPYLEQEFGAWHVVGGLHRLAAAVRDRAVERGATVRVGTDVVEVTVAGGRVDGVRLASGGTLPADVVIANADALHVYRDLVRAPRALRRVAGARPSFSGFALLLGLRGRTPGLGHHTVSFPQRYDDEFDDLAAGRPVADPAVYLCSPADAVLAPPGHEAWFVLVNAPRHGTGPAEHDWGASVSETYRDHLLGVLARRGLDVTDRLDVCGIRTPADIERDTRSPGGAIYGTSSDGPRSAFLRPANRSPVPGLFLVGGSSHPGGGLPLVTLSARIVAGLVGAP